jgi:hypothetical protein
VDIKAFNGKCWWNGEAKGSGVCLSLEGEYNCEELSPFVCDGYEIVLSSLIITDEPCFYNGDKNKVEPESKCHSMGEIIECSDIHTNILFEIEKYYCDDAKDIFSWIRGTGCIWVIDDDDGNVGKCVQMESCSDLIRIKNGSQCSDYSSPEGSCFFNGDSQVNNTEVRCSNVVDVMRCGDILDVMVCIYAKKDTFPNLIIDSLSSSSTMYCVWEGEKNACVSRNSFKAGMQCIELGIDFCERFEGCAVVGGMTPLILLNRSSFFFFRYLY